MGLSALSGHVSTKNKAAQFVFWFGACLGVLFIGKQAVQTELENGNLHQTLAAAMEKLEKLGAQNQSVLNILAEQRGGLARTTSTDLSGSDDPEVKRRRAILLALRNEYILSHEVVSTAMMAGLEWPPADWTNDRLRQLGETWEVGEGGEPKAATIRKPAATPEPRPQEYRATQPAPPTEEKGVFDNMDYRMSATQLRKVGGDVLLDVVAEPHGSQPIRLYISGCYLLDQGGTRWELPPMSADSGHFLQDAADLIPGTKLRSEFHFITKEPGDGREFTFICNENTPRANRKIILAGIRPI
jgi:hypothetical protein